MAGITEEERYRRLELIKERIDDGYTQEQISEELGIPVATVNRNVKYLKNLANADIKPADVAEKRAEIWLRLGWIIENTKEDYNRYKQTKPKIARECLITQISAIKLQAMIYGLIMKGEGVQVNQQFNERPIEKINPAIGDKIAKDLIRQHEDSMRKKNEIQ